MEHLAFLKSFMETIFKTMAGLDSVSQSTIRVKGVSRMIGKEGWDVLEEGRTKTNSPNEALAYCL